MYPPAARLRRCVTALAQANDFKVDTASRTPASQRARVLVPCCLVQQTPAHGVADDYYVGIDSDGYPIVSDVLGGAPIRVSRWLLRAKPGEVAAHSCDRPACVARAHLRACPQRENLADAIAKGRRRRKPPASPVRGGRASVAHTRPARSNVPRRADPRDAVFCVAGFNSPSKMARKLMRGVPPRHPVPPRALPSRPRTSSRPHSPALAPCQHPPAPPGAPSRNCVPCGPARRERPLSYRGSHSTAPPRWASPWLPIRLGTPGQGCTHYYSLSFPPPPQTLPSPRQ